MIISDRFQEVFSIEIRPEGFSHIELGISNLPEKKVGDASGSANLKVGDIKSVGLVLSGDPNLGAAFAFALSWPGQDANREGWVLNGQVTGIPTTLGPLIAQL